MRPSALLVLLGVLGFNVGLAACSSTPPPTNFRSFAGNDAGGSGNASAGGANGTGSTGSGGTGTGSTGSGGTAGAGSDRGPTPAQPGVSFPFPQNRQSTRCSYPNYRHSDVRAAYDKWKADTVTSAGAGGHLRIRRLANDPGLEQGSTVSEGIAYGMLLAVYMNDQPLFDELWKYERLWLGQFGLMDWYINAAGTDRLGTGAASDADEDMAWALLMAERQWGGSGSLGDTYANIARDQINLIWLHEIHEGKLLKPGDQWGDWDTVNISYFAPSYYRVFATATGNAGWNDVVQTVYDTLANSLNAANGNTTNGLVPAWCTSNGVPNPNVFAGAPTHYQYDSCRTPFRIGLDWCLNGDLRASAYVMKTSQFFSFRTAAGIVDGYNLDGSPRPAHASGQSAAFVGPVAVGAMADGAHASLMNEGYSRVATLNLLVGGEYYDESWTALSLLMMSGNFLDYTQEVPFAP
jgi:endo-1,4-beta-D-glucanase Y